jgi:hypothetical protein
MPSTSDFDSQSTELLISEQTGDQRTLTLRGRGLPYRPYSLSGSQRNSDEWYNGNPVGVLQVYGSKEEPSTMTGWWKDVFIGEGASNGHQPYAEVESPTEVSTLLTAAAIVDLVDDMRVKGQLLQVSWFNQVRYGIIEKFTHKWHTTHDIEYDIEFKWIGRDQADIKTVPFTNPTAANDLADAPNQIGTYTDQLDPAATSFSTAFGPSAQDIVIEIDAQTAVVQSLSDDLANAVVQIAQSTTTTSDAQRRVSGVLDGIKIESMALRDMFGDVADGDRLNLGGTFADVLADRSTMRQQAAIADQAATLAAAQQKKIIANVQSQVVAVFQARQNDDLRRVSTVFTGTPDNWQTIMLYNELDDDKLSSGQIVFVPANLTGVTS